MTAAAWIAAGELVASDTLLLADGSTSVVTAVSATTAEQTVHNLTVADLHTYYVLVGDAAVLVHNCPPGPSGASSGDDLLLSANQSSRMTTPQATEMANYLGFQKTNYLSQNQAVYTDGARFITQDVTAHSLGVWKMARSATGFGPGERLGTFDFLLNWFAK